MLQGGSSTPVDSSIAIPRDMGGHEIYDRMRNNVQGRGSLDRAQHAAGDTKALLSGAEQALRKYQQAIAAGIQGGSGDAAHNAAKPSIDGLVGAQSELEQFGSMASAQANSFDQHAAVLTDMPNDPPDFMDRLGGHLNPFSDSSPANDGDAWNAANAKNKAAFQGYGGLTQQYAGAMPNQQAPALNTFDNLEIYNPKRTPGHGGSGGTTGGPPHPGGTGGGPGGGSGGHSGQGGPGATGGSGGSIPAPGGGAPGHGGASGPGGGAPGADQPAPQPIGLSGGTSTAGFNPAATTLPTSPYTAAGTGAGGGFGADGYSPVGGLGGLGGPGAGFGAGGGAAGSGAVFGGEGRAGEGRAGEGRAGEGRAGEGRFGGGAEAGRPEPGAGAGARPGAGAGGARTGALGEGATGRGAAGGGAPMGAGRGGKGDEDTEHQSPSYLVNEQHGNEIIGELPQTAPPVIGD